MIGSTRLFRVKNVRAQAVLATISEAKLRVVSEATDRLAQWALNTLTRLKRESSTLLMWLRSAHSDSPYPQPFHLPQEPMMVK